MSTKITILKNLYEESACEKLLNGHILYTLFVLKIPTNNIYTQINIVKNANNRNQIARLKKQYKKHNNLYKNQKYVQLFKDLCYVQFNIDNSITNTIEKVAKIPELYVHNEIVTKNVPHIVTKKCIYHKEIIKNINKEISIREATRRKLDAAKTYAAKIEKFDAANAILRAKIAAVEDQLRGAEATLAYSKVPLCCSHRCRFHLATNDEDASDGNCDVSEYDGGEDIDDDDGGDESADDDDDDDDGICGDDDGDIDNESADVDDDGMCGDDDEDIDDDGDEGSVDVDADDKDVSDDEMECDDIKGDCNKSFSDIVDCNKNVSDIVDCDKSVSDIVDCNKSVSNIVDCNKIVTDILDCNKSNNIIHNYASSLSSSKRIRKPNRKYL